MSVPEKSKKAPQFTAFKPASTPVQEACSYAEACDTQRVAPLPESGNQYTWVVNGMDCAACARKVENAVRQVAGVEQVQVPG